MPGIVVNVVDNRDIVELIGIEEPEDMLLLLSGVDLVVERDVRFVQTGLMGGPLHQPLEFRHRSKTADILSDDVERFRPYECVKFLADSFDGLRIVFAIEGDFDHE